MAPNAARARKIARRLKEQEEAAEAAIHTVPSSSAALQHAEEADLEAEDREVAERAQLAGLDCFCVTCHTTDPDAFSTRMLNKRGRHGERVRRCRACVAAAEEEEHKAAVASGEQPESANADAASHDPVECGSCGETKLASAYSRTQLGKLKKGGSARCLVCVQQSQ